MEKRRLLLGVDIGTNESKGVLVDETFRPVASFSVPHTMENSFSGNTEQGMPQ